MTDSLLAWMLAAILVWAGALNVVGPGFIRAEFEAWGYPAWLRIAAGLAEWSAALALLFPPTRVLGCALAIAVLLGVLATLARYRQWMRLEYPLVMLFLSVWIGARAVGF